MLKSYDEFLHLVQTSKIFSDSKTFVDCELRVPVHTLLEQYNQAMNQSNFELKAFVEQYFELPAAGVRFESDVAAGVEAHIERLWSVLTQAPENTSEGVDKAQEAACGDSELAAEDWSDSLIKLPHPYVVPGGRFREIYYWDSYFTMLGLRAAGRWDLISHMLENFAYLIDTVGYIPNGNRRYYLGRSQPPYFALMVDLLAEERGDACYLQFLPQLKREYAFWQNGAEALSKANPVSNRCVRMSDGSCLNRYWDAYGTPRPESYIEDLELVSDAASINVGEVNPDSSLEVPAAQYRHIRAGAESGWDFSSRWFRDQQSMAQIHTTDIIPVDLNVLLVHLARTLAKACSVAGEPDEALAYVQAADNRAQAIQKHCWDADVGFYRDIDFTQQAFTPVLSLAAVFPLYFQIATGHQARRVAGVLEQQFLQAGGLTTTLNDTGQQWDAPNGWAPLHWMAVQGLRHFGYYSLAEDIKQRWVKLNCDVFERTGKLLEKYNVYDTSLEGGGGEYPVQDGFGWTNGVLLQFLREHDNKAS